MMNKFKLSNYIFHIFSGILIITALSRLLEPLAFEFLKEVSEKNLTFLGLISEVKLILSSVSHTNIPFISGDTAELNSSLNKVENYLFLVNIISLLQLMILAISKSWLLKIAMVILFATCFINKIKVLSARILVLTLTLNPGLSIFTIAIKQISAEASINFGSNYAQDLKTTVAKLQTEKSQLMQEHAKRLNQINNSEKGVVLFKKLKEDVSYDLQKVKLEIHGEYANLRALIRDAGNEIIRKMIIFCTMILFFSFVLPIGYAIIIYIIYNKLFSGGQELVIENLIEHMRSLYREADSSLNSFPGNTKIYDTITTSKNIVVDTVQQQQHQNDIFKDKTGKDEKALSDKKSSNSKSSPIITI